MSTILPRLIAVAVATATLTATPALAQDIYGTARGWTIRSEAPGGSYAGCFMTRSEQGFDLMLGQSHGNWYIAFPWDSAPGSTHHAVIDVDRYSDQLTLVNENGLIGSEIGAAMAHAIGQGNAFTISIDGTSYSLSLHGTAAAIAKVEECDTNQGVAPTAATGVENDAYNLGAGCPAAGTVRSPAGGAYSGIDMRNQSDMALTVYHLDDQGQPNEVGAMLPGQDLVLDWAEGHYFIARDFGGTCHGGVMQSGQSGAYQIR